MTNELAEKIKNLLRTADDLDRTFEQLRERRYLAPDLKWFAENFDRPNIVHDLMRRMKRVKPRPNCLNKMCLCRTCRRSRLARAGLAR